VIRAVLFDRDGTLVHDAAGNRDPARISPMACAREALQFLREREIRIGVVTNQPGCTQAELEPLHNRIQDLIGPIDFWFVCTHASDEGCACRKPKPGLIFHAMRSFGIEPHECAVIGDIGSDMQAASSAGVRSVLVPTPVTLPEEVAAAPAVATTLLDAVRLIAA
jgi:HAD superfamily hydrolase (TIGR01662 family)